MAGSAESQASAPRNVGDTERLASIAGGTALILNGILRPSTWRTMLALGGVALLQRGLTGHCAVYQGLGIDHREREALPQRTYGLGKRGEHSLQDAVDAASDSSFPASDPPSWTPVGGTATAH